MTWIWSSVGGLGNSFNSLDKGSSNSTWEVVFLIHWVRVLMGEIWMGSVSCEGKSAGTFMIYAGCSGKLTFERTISEVSQSRRSCFSFWISLVKSSILPLAFTMAEKGFCSTGPSIKHQNWQVSIPDIVYGSREFGRYKQSRMEEAKGSWIGIQCLSFYITRRHLQESFRWCHGLAI